MPNISNWRTSHLFHDGQMLEDDAADRLRAERAAVGGVRGGRPRIFIDTPTPQQLAVLRARCEGLLRQEVADRLFLSPRTVDFHLQCLFDLWDVSNILQAYNEAMARGLIDPPARRVEE